MLQPTETYPCYKHVELGYSTCFAWGPHLQNMEARGQSAAPHMYAGAFLGFEDIQSLAWTFVEDQGIPTWHFFDKEALL